MEGEKNKNAGYMTVEAVLVFSSMLIIIFALIYSMLLLYQNVVLMHAATAGAQEIAYAYASTEENIDIEDCIDKKLKYGLFKPSDVEKEIYITEGFQPSLRVSLKYKIKFPFRAIAEMISGEDVATMTVTSVSRSVDRPQYIRTINLICEVAQRGINKISDITFGIVEKVVGGK